MYSTNYKLLTPEVKLHHLKVGHPDRGLGDALLVVIVPLAPQPLRLIPDLNQVLVILDHNVVFIKLAIHVWLSSTLKLMIINSLISKFNT